MQVKSKGIEQKKKFSSRKMMFGKFRKLFLIGIGGAGMSGIAEVLHNLGFEISGSDSTPSEITEYLQSKGINIFSGHKADNIVDADVIVISSAIDNRNPELIKAAELGIPIIKRAEMLGELMRLKYSIGVAGTHGKTTTTSMIGRILQQSDSDPTIIVGGVVSEMGTGAALGSGEYLVAEADEYDKSFLAMYPTIAVVTNIEADHLECYGSFDNLKDAFLTFVNRVPFYGSVIISADDENIESIRGKISRPVVSFGFGPEADIQAVDIKVDSGISKFAVYHKEEMLGEITLHVPGKFNIANALAAIAAAFQLEIPFDDIASGLSLFSGVNRRFEILGVINEVIVVDDYAHHPTEISATLKMAKENYDRRLIVVFQPHLYSRTKNFVDEYAEALKLADVCILTDIYPAREKPIEGVSSELIKIKAEEKGYKNFEYVGKKINASPRLLKIAQPGDLIIIMGAGSITYIKDELLDGLKNG